MADLIIKGARENNLKSINLVIAENKITGIIGPSGSGKSSLAFNTIYAEGQRRYIESLSSYARQFLEKIDKPKVDSIENISPTIAIEQKNRIKNSRGTVGLITEIDDYLRFLFAHIGKVFCPVCQSPIIKYSLDDVFKDLFFQHKNKSAFLIFEKETTAENLIIEGYYRVLINNELINLNEAEVSKKIEFFKIVYDRFIIEDEEITRIKESLENIRKISYKKISIFLKDEKEVIFYNLENTCSKCSYEFPSLETNLFSFDSPLGACTGCHGFGNILKWDERKTVPNQDKSLLAGAVEVLNKPSLKLFFYQMINFFRSKNIDVNKPYKELNNKEKNLIYKGGGKGKDLFVGLNRIYEEFESKKYKVHVRVFLSRYRTAFTCKECHGARLNDNALSVKISDKNIYELQKLSVAELSKFLTNLNLLADQKDLCREALKQLFQRTNFLIEIGLSYLTLNRLAKTLSNGEAQRINLANQLSSSLVDTIYVLDEPSIGLHPRDINRLIKIIHRLRDNGNKVIVVEHDNSLIKSFDNIVELGPKSGIMGGELIFSGSIDDFYGANTLCSNDLIKTKFTRKYPLKINGEYTKFIEVKNAKENNLKNIDVKIPLERLVCITGVSGSGKSSFVKCLRTALAKFFDQVSTQNPVEVHGLEQISSYSFIDQSSISKTRKSTPITYLKAFDLIREIFAQTTLSKSRGYTASNFSFNTSKGQCSDCTGDGFVNVDMHFMSDITMPCETCSGTRYKPEVLDVTYKGLNISEVLNLSVIEAYEFFISNNSLRQVFKLLIDVGLEYILIGQSSDTLSGGEAQRLKISLHLLKHMISKKKERVLFLLDEPTTGLHNLEVNKLIDILERLIGEENSVIVIEHNLDFIANSDYVIDLGPDGGDKGGNLISASSPEELTKIKNSYTGKFLKEFMN